MMISRITFGVMLDALEANEKQTGDYCHTVGQTESRLLSLGFSREQVAGWRTMKDRLDDALNDSHDTRLGPFNHNLVR